MKTFTPIRGMITCLSGGEYMHTSDYEKLERQNEKLQQQAESLRCCGNCISYQSGGACVENYHWNEVCPKWKSDGLTAKEREI